MATKRIAIHENLAHQNPILSISNEGVATKGNRYIVGAEPTGIFAALTTNNIAWYDGVAWNEDTPLNGWEVYNVATSSKWSFIVDTWVEAEDSDISGKMDKVEQISSEVLEDKIVVLDATGNAANSGVDIDDVSDAVSKAHTQNTDQYLDQGGANEISAAQVKEAYDRRGVYDADLGCILMEFDD